MKVYLVAIRDEKVEQFMQLLGVRTEGEARRLFSDEINREVDDNLMRRHPQDYTLYSFGWFDAGTGAFELKPMPELLVNGAAVYVSADDKQMRLKGVN